ncbi:MAG: DUF1800 domain-containing protein [Burkholderiaceae bacterium]|nr:DUF1800 domain-containing protein [Burkholderiaceae bacterium]
MYDNIVEGHQEIAEGAAISDASDVASQVVDHAKLGVSVAALASLTACGGAGSLPALPGIPAPTPTPTPPPTAISANEAARFLFQAAMGAPRSEIANVQRLGYAGWLDAQFAMPASGTRWDWLLANGYDASTFRNSQAGFDSTTWRKLIISPDTLRQRLTLALSEILVVSINGLVGGGWRAFAGAGYLDLLEANCFGNYRNLLELVSTSPAMGEYLTFLGNTKYNPITGALPDENYAREIMQLFSIGLLKLNLDGTASLVNGEPVETYGLDDITGLARIFTGWDFDLRAELGKTPDFIRRSLVQVPSRHETGASTFLGSTVPAGLSGTDALKAALDIIYAHPNVAPFISSQLIQRLVTSNPSPAYVARIATVFNNDGKGVKGNLKAVVRAILLDDEARSAANLTNPKFGKVREPMLRFLAWARAFNANSSSDTWQLGDTSDPATRLGQSPLRSPTVFNFFRPGYVPPNSSIGSANLTAPEFQITNESSVVGYVNYMQAAVSRVSGINDVIGNYSTLLPLADDAASLLDELNTVLAAGQLSFATLTNLRNAVGTMPSGTEANRLKRIYAALTLVLAAPEFIVLK